MNKDHEFCLRCGRKLKNPVAREKGYGIVCERKMKVESTGRLLKNFSAKPANDV